MKKINKMLFLLVVILLPFIVYASPDEVALEDDTGEDTPSIHQNIANLGLNTDTNYCQKGVVEVARQYYYRGKNIIYNNMPLYKGKNYFKYLDKNLNVYKTINLYTNDNSGTSNYVLADFSPEDATEYNRYYTTCSNYVWQVYNEAFDYDITDVAESDIVGGSSATTSGYMNRYKKLKNNTNVVPYYYAVDANNYPTEEVISEELDKIKTALRVGDIVVIRRSDNTGHAMLYIGDNSSPLEDNPPAFIESTHKVGEREQTITENIYSYDNKLAPYDTHGTIYINNASNWFNSSSGYYLFYKNATRYVNEIIIIRPLTLITEGQACDEAFVRDYSKTYKRVNYPGLVAEITSSLDRTETVEPGDKITFTITVTNKTSNSMKVNINGDVPEYTELVSGDPVQENVTIPAGETKKVSYVVSVDDNDELYRLTIENRSNVSGIDLNVLEYAIAGKIDSEKELVINDMISDDEFTSTIDMISSIYKELYSYNGFDTYLDNSNPDKTAAEAFIKSVLKEYESMETVGNNYSNCTANVQDSSKYDCKFKIYTLNYDYEDEELASMAVDRLYGGYLVSNTDIYETNRRRVDIRVKDLQPGDILSVISYDGTGNKIYDTSSWKENIYLYVGNSKIAYVEDDEVKVIDITDERPVIQNGNTYTAGEPVLIENLHGEVAYTVHRPALMFTKTSNMVIDSPDTLDNVNTVAQVIGGVFLVSGACIVFNRKRKLNNINAI